MDSGCFVAAEGTIETAQVEDRLDEDRRFP